MQNQWCWRCKADVPMLDEAEWSQAYPMFEATLKAQKDEARDTALRNYEVLCAELERVFGAAPDDPMMPFWHNHRLAHFGPPCQNCGKVLRTPFANKCVECGSTRT